MIKLLFILFTTLPMIAFAAGGSHGADHDPHAIPWGTIGVQFFNFAILFGLLAYLLRHAVIAHFKTRASAYTDLVNRAETARQEAERSHREIAGRLQTLQASADESVRRAQAEAAQMRDRMIEDAKSMAKRMEEEAKRTIELETEKAKAELRAELLRSALDASRESFKKSIGSTEQKRLQTEFVEKIQVVR